MSLVGSARAFPFAMPDPLEPSVEYRTLQQREPVTRVTLPSGDVAWLVTRYDDVRRVLSDQRFSREAITRPDAPRLLPIARGSKSIFVMDPPQHSRLRRLIGRAFAPRKIETMRPRICKIAFDLLSTMINAGQPADLIASFAKPLPISVICELLGVPLTDASQFQAWTDVILSFDTNAAEDVFAARTHLNDYLSGLIAAKRRAGGDGLLMVLIAATEDGEQLSEDELVTFGYTLLGAGYHATTSYIVHSVLSLLRDHDQIRRLQDDPDLLPTAVEELLRRSQAGGGLGALRIATADIELGGVIIHAGEAVLPSINSANRDAAVFENPDRFDPARSPNPHIAFGYGIHHCLGAQLGRMELEIALSGLLQRFPSLRLAVPEEHLTWNAGVAFTRPAELPIVW